MEGISELTYLNKNFRFVYTPNYSVMDVLFPISRYKKRFLVGAGALSKWISAKNAETVKKSAINSKTDKTTVKFRKYGKIQIYVK